VKTCFLGPELFNLDLPLIPLDALICLLSDFRFKRQILDQGNEEKTCKNGELMKK